MKKKAYYIAGCTAVIATVLWIYDFRLPNSNTVVSDISTKEKQETLSSVPQPPSIPVINETGSPEAGIVDSEGITLPLEHTHQNANTDSQKAEKLPWRKPSEHFATFIDLSSKPLISSEERDQFTNLVNNYQMIGHARSALMAPVTGPELDFVQERKRLDAVYYLTSIISGKYSSSQFDHAVQLVYDVLNSSRIESEFSKDLKKSLVGDKVELGMVLAVFKPEIWEQYKNSYQSDESQHRLIEYIELQAIRGREQLRANAERIANRLRENTNS